jgi:dihydrofolate synthase/folylpolyglutamate synthase
LQPQLPVSEQHIREGLANVRWPGRLQLVERGQGRRVLLDGAHNSAGVTSLRAAMEEHFPDVQPAIVLGIMADKDWDLMCEILAPLAGRILCVPVHSERTAKPDQLREACRRTNPDVLVDTCISLTEALGRTQTEPFTVVAGSLYLIGEAMELLHVAAAPNSDEKGLNEWTGKTVQS